MRKVTDTSNGLPKNERIYLGGVELFRQYGPGGAIGLERETLHVTDDTKRVALVETRTRLQGSDPAPRQLVRFQLANHLGSATVEVDQDAQIVSYEEYHPYGTTAYEASRSQTDTPKQYRYTGKERDEETGFTYHTARYYMPWLGRWASSDPRGLADGLNTYGYARCNPTSINDPTGGAGESVTNPTDQSLKQEIEHRTGKTVEDLWLQLGRGPTAIDLRELLRSLYSNGTLKPEIHDGHDEDIVQDEVVQPHPYRPDRFQLVTIVGPAASVEQRRTAGLQASLDHIRGGLSAGAGAVKGSSSAGLVQTPGRAVYGKPSTVASAPGPSKPSAPPSVGPPAPGGSAPTTPPSGGGGLPSDVDAFTKAFNASGGNLLNALAKDVAAKLPGFGIKNPRLIVGISAGVIGGKVQYRVTVSDPAAWKALKQHESELPAGLKVGPQPSMVNGKLDPMRHVEVEGPLGLKSEGAKGIVVGTSGPACKDNCEPQWIQPGSPPDVWHSNVDPKAFKRQ